MTLQQRQVEVSVGQPGESGVSWSGLRVGFDVKLTRNSDPNEADIQIYGLTRNSVARFQEEGAVVRLRAGYDTPRLIFQGNPVSGGLEERNEGPERTLKVEAQDTALAIKETFVTLSYGRTITLERIARDIAEQMGLSVGRFQLPEGANTRVTNGGVFSGQAKRVLDRIAKSRDLDISIQAGALQVLPQGESAGNSGVLFSAEKGNLVGAPLRKDKGVEVKALLEPALRPGDVFVLQSEDHSGFFQARDVTFRGDSGWRRPFYTIVTARPIDGGA